MQELILELTNHLKKHEIEIRNKYLKKIIDKFDWFYYSKLDQIEQDVITHTNDSKIIIIDEYQNENGQYFIICFDYKIIIYSHDGKEKYISSKSFFNEYFSNVKDYDKYFLKNGNIFHIELYEKDTNFTEYINNLRNEIPKLSKELMIKNSKFESIWNNISKSLSAFLIKKAYKNSRDKHDKYFDETFKEHQEKCQISNKSFIELRLIGNGAGGVVFLIYYISTEEIYALKIPYKESIYLNERERDNYLHIRYPFIVPYYGYIEISQQKNLLLEYVEGQALSKYDVSKLNNREKCNIIFELLLTVRYLHSHEYIYRDLNVNIFIINQEKDAILIDFDRLIKVNDKSSNEIVTQDFNNSSPEVNKTYESDIYCLGCIFHYILHGKIPKLSKEKPDIVENYIFEACLNKDPSKRPNIIQMFIIFYFTFLSNIQCNTRKEKFLFSLFEEHLTEDRKPCELLFLGLIYLDGKFVTREINKTIHYYQLAASKNDPLAQFNLGAFYYEGKYVTRDVDKAIHYYSLAANQNHPEAQFNLGFIYEEGKYVKRDINKAIHYYSLAANQNLPQAQSNLGFIYEEGKYVTRNINKAIHYYSLAANQNHLGAQFNLGFIYYEGKYVTQDINKAIHYFSLAANQNLPQAQSNLGFIYEEGKYVTRDINKAIHYYSLAANQNHLGAQFNLGAIYYEGKYVTQDINKAIHYLSLAANQNIPHAQFKLGVIYYEGKYVTQDINKAIHYYSLASNQNHTNAQFQLGVIYYEGKYVTRDINKAIHYYSLAANQNHPGAQFSLGAIYYKGKYVTWNINKAIYYFSLAANQNIPQTQFTSVLIYSKEKSVTNDINSTIHYNVFDVKQDILQAQIILGLIYFYITVDIDKAIHYFILAANQNIPEAQFHLGFIYEEGKYVTQDISKAINYYSLAANQNLPQAQFNLGVIYSEGKYVACDIDKVIHYFSLAANQNLPQAQCNLGVIYSEGKYVTRDINKAIHYFSLAANQNLPQAQSNLGAIYYIGKYVTRDINKAIHYLTLAANQKYPSAQLLLGIVYYNGDFRRDIKKGRFYIMLASKNGSRIANFAHGFLLHEGKVVERNIEEAIHYYKEASCFNIQYAKNNLGIIYKHGYDGNRGEPGKAIVYFEEAIRQKTDYLSMFNLAHIYFYEKVIRGDINKAIELLIKSSNKFFHSIVLLSLILIEQFDFNIETVNREIESREYLTRELSLQIYYIIEYYKLYNKVSYKNLYETYRNKDFVYDTNFNAILASDVVKIIENDTPPKYPNAKNISKEFYEGFGRDLLY